MKHEAVGVPSSSVLRRVAGYAEGYAVADSALDPAVDTQKLRRGFDVTVPDHGRPVDEVIGDLIAAAEPGLVGSTREGFLSWVIGASHEAGVAADWLTSLWGQNAGIYQTSPASAACEEVVAGWLLDLLGLPRSSAVGFVTGATMASFTCLAAARSEVLRKAGYDVDRLGLQGMPKVSILIGAEAHVTNFAALRYLGFGESNFVMVETGCNGLMRPDALRAAAAEVSGPAILVAQAGHINSGGFDDFAICAEVARQLDAWVHVDGAFGLWAKATPKLSGLAEHVELADSWAVDGHKWLQTPYDSGFAIVRDEPALRRAMSKNASYLNDSADDGRHPAAYVPELSRRARGFPAWAMIQALGRDGIARMVESHCAAAEAFERRCAHIPEANILNDVILNQVAVSLGPRTQQICDRLNATGKFFLRTAIWRGQTIMRISFSGYPSGEDTAEALADAIEAIVGA